MTKNIRRCKKVKQHVYEFKKKEIQEIREGLEARPELMGFMNMVHDLTAEELQDIIKMMDKTVTA